MEIQLDLEKHCLITEIKRLYEQSISQYFQSKSAQPEELEKKIELFRLLLEYSPDLKTLRGKYSALAGGIPTEVSIFEEGSKFGVKLEGQVVFEQSIKE